MDNGNNGTVTYSLRNVPTRNGQPLFAIDPNNGLVTTVQSDVLDRERDEEYRLTVFATDRGFPALSGLYCQTKISKLIILHWSMESINYLFTRDL